MEDLLENDVAFELFDNSERNVMSNNRVLLSYPSEKSSFDVFLGFDAEVKDSTAVKPKIDAEKITDTITAGATAISSVGTTIQAFKGDGTKTPSRRKQLKEVCGRRPILKKKREGEYNKCVANFNANKTTNVEPMKTTFEETTMPPPPANNNKKIIIGVVVVAVLVTAFIGYKKGFFSKKAI